MEKWKKIRNFGTGFILFKIINFVFYTIVSPTIIFIFKDNIISGFTIVFLIIMRSMIIVWLYDKAKQDIFLIEKRKGLEAHPGVAKKEIKIKNRVNNLFLFLFLFLWDPAITVLYYRDGSHLFNGIPNKKIKTLFILSSILSTTMWLLGVSGLIFVIKNIFN